MKAKKLMNIFAYLLYVCLLFLIGSCSSQKVLYPDILRSLTALSEQGDDIVYDLYQEQIHEWTSLGAAYQVYYGRFDLDGDAIDEIIAYAMSTMNSGSLGNIQLDIWKENDDGYMNIGFKDALLLNPHEPGFEDLKVDIMTERQNGYCLIGITSQYSDRNKTQIASYSSDRYQLEDKT